MRNIIFHLGFLLFIDLIICFSSTKTIVYSRKTFFLDLKKMKKANNLSSFIYFFHIKDYTVKQNLNNNFFFRP